jgi:hypothetical protein
MRAAELARMMETWSDALNVAEVVGSPYLRVGASWDLHDWRAVESADGVQFQHVGSEGRITEAVLVVPAEGRRLYEPGIVNAPIPTWLLQVASVYPGQRGADAPVI